MAAKLNRDKSIFRNACCYSFPGKQRLKWRLECRRFTEGVIVGTNVFRGKGSGTGQRKNSNCNIAITKILADLTGGSGVLMAF